jgi:hypothetical protein
VTPLDDFALSLVKATLILGSLLEIAKILEVEPLQVWRWMSEIDRPPERLAKEFRTKLDDAVSSAVLRRQSQPST